MNNVECCLLLSIIIRYYQKDSASPASCILAVDVLRIEVLDYHLSHFANMVQRYGKIGFHAYTVSRNSYFGILGELTETGVSGYRIG
ncbi:MAG: hypothetical protein ACI85O_000972 [Saprospiraceae bacterium]|jgi:hypothetical protein